MMLPSKKCNSLFRNLVQVSHPSVQFSVSGKQQSTKRKVPRAFARPPFISTYSKELLSYYA